MTKTSIIVMLMWSNGGPLCYGKGCWDLCYCKKGFSEIANELGNIMFKGTLQVISDHKSNFIITCVVDPNAS
jgi:hypothetical protein